MSCNLLICVKSRFQRTYFQAVIAALGRRLVLFRLFLLYRGCQLSLLKLIESRSLECKELTKAVGEDRFGCLRIYVIRKLTELAGRVRRSRTVSAVRQAALRLSPSASPTPSRQKQVRWGPGSLGASAKQGRLSRKAREVAHPDYFGHVKRQTALYFPVKVAHPPSRHFVAYFFTSVPGLVTMTYTNLDRSQMTCLNV
jgi:hypothetical protein